MEMIYGLVAITMRQSH